MSDSNRLIIVVATLVLAFVLGFFLVWPLFQQFASLREGIGQKQTELSFKEKYYDYFKTVDGDLDKYSDVLGQIDGAVPDSYSLPLLYYYLQKTAGESGLLLNSLSLGGITAGKIKEININLKVSGTYPSLKSFLASLENSMRIFNVKTVSFSSPREGRPFIFDLAVVTYSY